MDTKSNKIFNTWWKLLPTHASGLPAKGTVGGALVVIESLKEDFLLDIDDHRAAGGSQIRGVSGAAAQAILEAHGETRIFLSEGGRTNRGLAGDIESLLRTMQENGMQDLSIGERNLILGDLQLLLVEKVREYFGLEKLKFFYDPSQTTYGMIETLLRQARMNGKGGQLAEYLVGAKLSLRFPATKIDNKPFSSADQSRGVKGDFWVGDSVFHVTLSPMIGHYEKCRSNISEGLRPYLLVPSGAVDAARQTITNNSYGNVSVEGIESFISQNIDELAGFSRHELAIKLYELLLVFNERVDAVENDKSILLDIPDNLRKASTS